MAEDFYPQGVLKNISPAAVTKLGVGLAYQATLRSFIDSHPGVIDFLEIVPDILWTDLGPERGCRYVEEPSIVEFLDRLRTRLPVVPHSIGLSIGSAHRWNNSHLAQIERWHQWLDFPWYSDHLAFNLADLGGDEVNIGVTLPLPLDHETIALLAPRISEVYKQIQVPFLLENNVYYFRYLDEEFVEPEFLNTLCFSSGCFLLLDLHNVYTNSRNHNFDPFVFLKQLDLSRVVEIHVAGGMEYDGFYLDSHSGCVPPPVWELLDWTLPRCINAGGVVFEMLGSWFDTVGDDRLTRDLNRMRELWQRHQLSQLQRMP
jgi:uncharacterized protein